MNFDIVLVWFLVWFSNFVLCRHMVFVLLDVRVCCSDDLAGG